MQKIRFLEVNPGERFKSTLFEERQRDYIKLDKDYFLDGCGRINAVGLEDGRLYDFSCKNTVEVYRTTRKDIIKALVEVCLKPGSDDNEG